MSRKPKTYSGHRSRGPTYLRQPVRRGSKASRFLAMTIVLIVGVGWVVWENFEEGLTWTAHNIPGELPENYGLDTVALSSPVCSAGVSPAECNTTTAWGHFAGDDDRIVLTVEQLEQCGPLVNADGTTGDNSLVQAVLAAEDNGFFQHAGVDREAIVRAQIANFISGETVQGGSTIDMQLAQLVTGKETPTYFDKFEEGLNAHRLNDGQDKRTILAAYLSLVPLGRGVYGAEAASVEYFGKSLAAGDCLTIAEAAFLAGIIRGPALYDPYKSEDEATSALARRNRVIDAMVDNSHIKRAEAREARQVDIMESVDSPTKATGFSREGNLHCGMTYVMEEVRQQLNAIGQGEAVFSPGGLNIVTTIDYDLQCAAWNAAYGDGGPLSDPSQPSAGMVLLDNKTGRVMAMVGGRRFTDTQVNLAGFGPAGLLPGSTFKTVALVAALERGIAPLAVYDVGDSGVYTDPDTGRDWSVGGGHAGSFTLEECLWQSNNTCFAQMATESLGGEPIAEMGARLGVSTELEPVTSLVLGTSGVSVMDMTRAYSTLANHGNRVDPWLVQSVTDRTGAVIYDAPSPVITAVIDPEIADTTTTMLDGVMRYGTGTGAAEACGCLGQGVGKTGTNNDNSSAWFVGYTSRHTLAVFVGYPGGGNAGVSGPGLPATLWGRVMREVIALEGAQDIELVDLAAG